MEDVYHYSRALTPEGKKKRMRKSHGLCRLAYATNPIKVLTARSVSATSPIRQSSYSDKGKTGRPILDQ